MPLASPITIILISALKHTYLYAEGEKKPTGMWMAMGGLIAMPIEGGCILTPIWTRPGAGQEQDKR
tara:strand:+ start:70 stop:267 length:198 start_codon:yes stop_codon:yes gene_type:complete